MLLQSSLIAHLNQIVSLSNEIKEAILEISHNRVFEKKEILVAQGEVCQSMFFINKGCVRDYFLNDKQEEVVVWFGFENDISVSLASFSSQTPSRTSIQALEKTYVTEIKRADLLQLYDRFHEVERLGRLITENYLNEIENYHYSFHHLFGIDRYEQLIQTKPFVFQRIPLSMIASYLGVSVETLSRFRGQKK